MAAERVLRTVDAILPPPLVAPFATRLRATCALRGGEVRSLTGHPDVTDLLRVLDRTLAEAAESAGNIEEAWLAHWWLAEALGADAEHHRRRAAELVMAAYASLPEELKRTFLQDPVRKAILEAGG